MKILKPKYDIHWAGIDGGREGLWKDPLWTDVLVIISNHQSEAVYDQSSAIYKDLLQKHPLEKWISYTREGAFRPLFRDYPHPWTRTQVVSLDGGLFHVTWLGQSVLAGKVTKTDVLVSAFRHHNEPAAQILGNERPFAILAEAFMEAPRALSLQEICWCIMQNYRPGNDNLIDVLKKSDKVSFPICENTPKRRVRNFLSLLRSVGAIQSHRRPSGQVWSKGNCEILKSIIEEPKKP